jgi:hypothetical protein
VRTNVLPSNVGDEPVESMRGPIKDHASFLRRAITESLCAQEKPKLERHIEPGQSVGLRFHLGSGNVVDAVATLTNQLANIVDPNFTTIWQFFAAARGEAASRNTKDDGLENRLILLVERTVDEDAGARGDRHLRSAVFGDQPDGRAGTRPNLCSVARRMISLQSRQFSHCALDHRAGNSSVALNLYNRAVLRGGHTGTILIAVKSVTAFFELLPVQKTNGQPASALVRLRRGELPTFNGRGESCD